MMGEEKEKWYNGIQSAKARNKSQPNALKSIG